VTDGDARVAEVDGLNARLRQDLAAEATAAARADAALARARREHVEHRLELDGFEHEQRLSAQAVAAILDLVLGSTLNPGQEQLVRLARRALADASSQHTPEVQGDDDAARAAVPVAQGFNLRRAVASVLRLLAPRTDKLGLELVARFSQDVPSRVEADRALLWRALTLIADFHVGRSHDDPAVYVNVMLAEVPAAERESHERTILFTVEDSGAALEPGQLATLFDPAATRELGSVGLAFARRLAEAGGGALSVEAIPDGGLRTTFALPAVRLKRVTVTTLYGRGALTEKAILVVDDVAHSRAVVSELISAWRLLPTAVASGEAALDALRSAARTGQPFDAIVLDRQMPELDGVQLLRAIRDDPAIGPQRILLLDTAAGQVRALPEDVRAMVGDVVQKPVVPSELLEALTVVLAPPRTPPQVTTRPVARPDPGRRPVKVLVAEDNPVNQMFVARMLERRGHHVTVAGNGAEVIDYLDTTPEPYDVILMDIQMPVLDGFETTAVIRERESRRPGRGRIPIVAVTAHAMKGEE
ncbi:MAG: response regulator, partial [Myxococcales bacterium]|nr:response regulator [Myxococcales bacterium]